MESGAYPAAAGPGSASCPLCLELLRDPVSGPCGHHFCRACIERRWQRAQPAAAFACPRCGTPAPRRSLRPSPELARLLEIARRLSRGGALHDDDDDEEEEEEEEGCRRHREPLEVFCREDAALLCAICRESRAHRAHALLPLPEAAREVKEQIQARLRALDDERDKLLELREAEMRRGREHLEAAAAERRRILSRFQGLRRSLDELSRRLLARLGALERDVGRAQEENATRLTEEISRLESRARELRERCGQPARTFLQDIDGALSSLGKEKLQLPPSPLPELEKRIHLFREENLLLEETLRSFQDILAFELPEKMTVTLDPGTAHPQLRVEPDGSGVSWERAQDPPGAGAGAGSDLPGTGAGSDPPGDGPGPGSDPPGPGSDPPGPGAGPGPGPGPGPGSDPPGPGSDPPGPGSDPPGDGPSPGSDPFVLAREGITAGRRCWDVQVAPAGCWALGVAREPPGSGAEPPGSGVELPGSGAEPPGSGAEPAEPPGSGAEPPGSGEWELWSMGQCQGQFWALTSLQRVPLFPARAPRRLRVALDYERGRVAFFDAEERSLIFAFPEASFEGQRVRPWFLVWGEGSRIALCP